MRKKSIPQSIYVNKQKISINDGTKAYRELRDEVTKAGILKRSYGFYTLLITSIWCGFLLSTYELYFVSHGLQMLLWGGFFALFAVQVSGFMHDAGHRAIFKSTKWNDFLGFICASTLVLPYYEWKVNHNKHHAKPNVQEEDPDLERPIIAFSEEKYLRQNKISHFLARYQVYLYYPLSFILFFLWQISYSVHFIQIFSKKSFPRTVMYIGGLFIWLVLPFLFLPAGRVILIDIIAYSFTGFYMYNIFAPNHKGMPQVTKDMKFSFLEHQIITTRNINSHWLTDFVYMGLNYQIEHHLFPNCPRNKLKLITPYVLDLCKKMHLEFTSVSIVESNKIILGELNRIAKINGTSV